MVPRAGLEPARAIRPGDFKSPVSTDFTTQARAENRRPIQVVTLPELAVHVAI